MKNTIFWILLLAVITIASYEYHEKNLPAPMAVEKPSEEKAIEGKVILSAPMATPALKNNSEPVQVPKMQPVQAVPAHANQSAVQRYATKPKDMVIEFELVDGYAVAYGDTLLGKPTSDFAGERGATEIRPPRYWEQGVVPYMINSDVVNPERVQRAIDFFNQNTSVKFVPFEGQVDALAFVHGDSNCASFLGRTGGAQPVFLSEKCGTPEIMHELMHALGFIHEQSRTDRDQFVEILWDHIQEKFQFQFAMVPEPLMDPFFNSPFDVSSIMMYEPHSFAVTPGQETMKMKNGQTFPPPLHTLSTSDIERVNRLYKK